MSFRNLNELAEILVGLGLVESADMEQFLVENHQLNDRVDDAINLLESKHLLTSYQARQLLKGETKGLVLGGYKLMYRNASGSFARVFRARSTSSGRMVGLKLLRKRWVNDTQTVALFHHEADVGQKLKHKNVVPIYDVGDEDGFHFFTMEFIEGGNLRDFINIRKKLSPAEATHCAHDMAQGLNHAMSFGITHRDLKMTNVLMSTQGVAKLVDFGLAVVEGSQLAGTESFQRALEYGTLEKGTSAPDNDPRSDLYFLGAIYYELLTGEPPYPPTKSREERKQLSRYSNIRPIRSLEPNLPRIVEEIVERLMKIDPNSRYQSAEGAISDLRLALTEMGESPDEGIQINRFSGNGSAAAAEPAQTEATPEARQLPTIMCIESRVKQQDLLRSYLTKHGFRVLVLNDMQRGLKRLNTNPPDCVVFMGESIGEEIVEGYQETSQLNSGASNPTVNIAVLSEKQADYKKMLEETNSSRVLVQPITLRDLRKEIHLALQRQKRSAS